MNIKITQANLNRLEKVFEETKYVLRFEKGTFTSGYCILEHKKVVVINKFLNMEGRINTLLDILSTLQLDTSLLSPDSLKLYTQVQENRNIPDAENPGNQEPLPPASEQSA